jgi:glucose-6-phosphate isomerase
VVRAVIDDAAMASHLRRLIVEDAVGQLRRRDGLMATLGSEDGALKLDWVEAVARLLADPAQLEAVEAEARAIRERGIRHIIWAGMGGSVLTVRVLCALGFGGGDGDAAAPPWGTEPIAIHPLDSTDPAALNAIVRAIAAAKGFALPDAARGPARAADAPPAPSAPAPGAAPEGAAPPESLRALLRDVLMIGVAMGMTSEEPITHLAWFTELLERAGLPPAEHLLVMALPGSYLDAFAREHQAPSRPLQVDGGTGTGGRMSAPATRVFLLPAALYLTGHAAEPGQLRSVLRRAWDEYDLDLAASDPAEHPYMRLAAALSAAAVDGACRMLVRMPQGWDVLVLWLEQLMEESLGKGGKGVVVFDDQALNPAAPGHRRDGTLRVRVVTEEDRKASDQALVLSRPSLASREPRDRLAALAACFLGWQLSMALYGYLHGIPFAGQPAVESYKARARALRAHDEPLAVTSAWRPAWRDGPLTLLAPRAAAGRDDRPVGVADASVPDPAPTPLAAFARALRGASPGVGPPGYLDVTVNGEAPEDVMSALDGRVRAIGNELLGIPVRLRRAPAAYHSTEQSEMDGPAYVVSLRLVARRSEACLLGRYPATFLHAQAVSTWQAMMEAGRPCFLLVLDGSLGEALAPLEAFLADVASALRGA